jgi:hypothetical protein
MLRIVHSLVFDPWEVIFCSSSRKHASAALAKHGNMQMQE